jgi:hypothetical protein
VTARRPVGYKERARNGNKRTLTNKLQNLTVYVVTTTPPPPPIIIIIIIIIITTTNYVALVRERTIPTERPPLVGEVSANFCL